MGEGGQLDDQYNMEQDTDAMKQKMFAKDDDEDDTGPGFLKVYKEGENQKLEEDDKQPKDIKFKSDAETAESTDGP